MNAGTIQQLVRIIAYSGGSMFFGQAVADGDLFQAFLGAIPPVVAFIWWALWERKRVS
jgi:hypothetical protein